LFAVALGKTNGKPDLDFEMLTGLQEQANEGALALATAGYVGWVLARGYEEVQSERKRLHHRLRAAAAMGENEHHKKTAHVVAELAVGLAFYLRYAVDVGAVDAETAERIWAKSSNALHEGAAAQAAYQAAAEPITRFHDLLASALASGKANLGNAADPMGEPPPKYRDQAGWEYVDQVGWKPRGACIGLIGEDESVFLDPSASIQVASTISRDTAEPFARSKQAVSTDLVEGGHIVARDSEKRGHATVRKVFKGRGRLAYWAVSPKFLWPSMSANTDHTDHGGGTPHGNAENRGQWPPFSGLKG
jgi:hypothetical protein